MHHNIAQGMRDALVFLKSTEFIYKDKNKLYLCLGENKSH